MNVGKIVLDNKFVVAFLTLLVMIASAFSYTTIGKLEDPVFTVKTAVVVTLYPGATAKEVEKYVTDKVERKLQEMGELDDLRSLSRPGMSLIYVDLKESLKSKQLPQQWDLLRKKVNDVKLELPPTAQITIVQDEFSDVYGMLFALHGKGYEQYELKEYARGLQRELKSIKGVKKVLLEGAPAQAIYININDEKVAQYGVTTAQVINELSSQNLLINSGSFPVDGEQIRVSVGNAVQTIDDIKNVMLRVGLDPINEKLIRLGDIAEVKKDYVQPLNEEMRYNGEPAITIALTPQPGVNVVAMGDILTDAIAKYEQTLPVGVTISKIAFQPHEVEKSINNFVGNLVGSVVVVIVILMIFMGLRSALITGASLIITMAATLCYMQLVGIDLQRISIGALILALGLLVDNAIVIVDMYLAGLKAGKDKTQAAIDPVKNTLWSLLGATIIAALGASPVLFSATDASEFTNSLFWVMGASLLFSWVVAITSTPLMCWAFLDLKDDSDKKPGKLDNFIAKSRSVYSKVLVFSTHHPYKTVGVGILSLILAAGLAMFLRVNFMPGSDRPVVFLDYWLPAGGRVEQVSSDMKRIEKWLMSRDEVKSVASYMGRGVPRFSVTVEPEPNDSSYGQILVTVDDYDHIAKLRAAGDKWLAENFPNAEPRFRPLKLATSDKFSLETRISGPDPQVLRSIAVEIKKIMKANSNIIYLRDDWRQQTKVLTPEFNQEKGRKAGVTRSDVSLALKRATEGFPVGMFRGENELIPIKIRRTDADLTSIADLDSLPVKGMLKLKSVPLSQVVDGYKLDWEDNRVWRRDRIPTLTVQADVTEKFASEVRQEILTKIDNIKLPDGYKIEWGGEFEEEHEAVVDIFTQLPKAALLMLIIMVVLFNNLRDPMVIITTLPMAALGVILALLAGGKPFGFMGLIGLITLSGMIIKNGIVLIDQIDLEYASGKSIELAVQDATKSRTMAIMMAALTTVFGMATLWTDSLYDQTAAAIIGGLSCATFATLFIMPALYCIFNKHKSNRGGSDE